MAIARVQRFTGPIQPAAPAVDAAKSTKNSQPADAANKPDFQTLLRQAQAKTDALQFSRHVQERIVQRNLHIDENQMQHLQQAVQLADEKGIRDSLVLTPDAAFIVNIPSKTVITAMERDNAAQRVFTNIDGAVVF